MIGKTVVVLKKLLDEIDEIQIQFRRKTNKAQTSCDVRADG